MKTRTAQALVILFLVFLAAAGSVQAHGGGLDAHGCHHDRRNGGYHCHQGPLAGKYFASQSEMLATLKAKNQESKDVPQWVLEPRRLRAPLRQA
ncbi:MAG: YHYH domain-containing protein [Nitrospira sp. CR1.3]|nr:YHYH domain-containing protein [Nitrospira sp. CR1.3]